MTTPRTKNKMTILRCRSVHRSDSILLLTFPPYCDSRDDRILSTDRLVGVLHGDGGIENWVVPLVPFLIGPLPFRL